MATATLTAIHRYPVKSMLGERLEQATLAEKGIPGDRGHESRDLPWIPSGQVPLS